MKRFRTYIQITSKTKRKIRVLVFNIGIREECIIYLELEEERGLQSLQILHGWVFLFGEFGQMMMLC